MTTLCAPTDRELFSILKTKTPTISSLIPERYGADILNISINSINGKLCIQRKTYPDDFLASKKDGRLAREIPLLMNTERPVLILEGRPEWTSDGHLMTRYGSKWTRLQMRNMIRTISIVGEIHVEYTDDLADTVEAIVEFISWHKKSQHTSLISRPKQTRDCWNVKSRQGLYLFILQGLPGVGSGLAEQILDYFGNKIPLKWRCLEKELRQVPGIGEKRAKQLWEILEEEK